MIKEQYDQIWRFIGLYATFQSLWKAINLPKSPTFLGNFCKCVKIFNFSREIILGNFYRHLAVLFWSHWPRSRSFTSSTSCWIFFSRSLLEIVSCSSCDAKVWFLSSDRCSSQSSWSARAESLAIWSSWKSWEEWWAWLLIQNLLFGQNYQSLL